MSPRFLILVRRGRNALGELAVEAGRPARIGRSRSCDFIVEEKDVSGEHLELLVENGELVARNTSRFGFHLGARLVQESAPFPAGQTLRLGAHIHLERADAVVPEPPAPNAPTRAGATEDVAPTGAPPTEPPVPRFHPEPESTDRAPLDAALAAPTETAIHGVPVWQREEASPPTERTPAPPMPPPVARRAPPLPAPAPDRSRMAEDEDESPELATLPLTPAVEEFRTELLTGLDTPPVPRSGLDRAAAAAPGPESLLRREAWRDLAKVVLLMLIIVAAFTWLSHRPDVRREDLDFPVDFQPIPTEAAGLSFLCPVVEGLTSNLNAQAGTSVFAADHGLSDGRTFRFHQFSERNALFLARGDSALPAWALARAQRELANFKPEFSVADPATLTGKPLHMGARNGLPVLLLGRYSRAEQGGWAGILCCARDGDRMFAYAFEIPQAVAEQAPLLLDFLKYWIPSDSLLARRWHPVADPLRLESVPPPVLQDELASARIPMHWGNTEKILYAAATRAALAGDDAELRRVLDRLEKLRGNINSWINLQVVRVHQHADDPEEILRINQAVREALDGLDDKRRQQWIQPEERNG